jgi:hypothetical protein
LAQSNLNQKILDLCLNNTMVEAIEKTRTSGVYHHRKLIEIAQLLLAAGAKIDVEKYALDTKRYADFSKGIKKLGFAAREVTANNRFWRLIESSGVDLNPEVNPLESVLKSVLQSGKFNLFLDLMTVASKYGQLNQKIWHNLVNFCKLLKPTAGRTKITQRINEVYKIFHAKFAFERIKRSKKEGWFALQMRLRPELLRAIYKNHRKKIVDCVAKGADPNFAGPCLQDAEFMSFANFTQNVNFVTPIHFAVMQKEGLSMLNLLVDLGASTTAANALAKSHFGSLRRFVHSEAGLELREAIISQLRMEKTEASRKLLFSRGAKGDQGVKGARTLSTISNYKMRPSHPYLQPI